MLGLALAAGCSTLPPPTPLPKVPSHALASPAASNLGRTVEPWVRAHADQSGFRLINTGIAGLTARIELIDAAEHTVDIQSYIFRADESGDLIALALLRAADRGVRIRILVDDGDTVAGDEKILSLAARAGVEVRIFNPFAYRGHVEALRAAEFAFHRARLDYRMHNKLMVADNAVAIIGGRNIGNQYFQIDPGSQFGDDDVIVAGPMVQRLSTVFDAFWNGDLAVPAAAIDPRHSAAPAFAAYRAELDRYRLELQSLHKGAAPGTSGDLAAAPLAEIESGRAPLVWAPVQVVYDSPDKKDVIKGEQPGRLIYKAVVERAQRVQTELLMVTPYFVPSTDELAALDGDRMHGARVQVLTNSLAAAPNIAAQSGYMHYRPELLRRGVALYEERALLGDSHGSGQTKAMSRHGHYALHAKLYVFDRRTLFVGSMNYDQRSKHLNTEIGLLIDSPELAREIAARFDALSAPENAYAVTLEPTGPTSGAGSGGKMHLVWVTRESGRIVRYAHEPGAGAWRRFEVALLSLLPIDGEL